MGQTSEFTDINSIELNTPLIVVSHKETLEFEKINIQKLKKYLTSKDFNIVNV